MLFFENPVLQRELLVNLRMTRSFLLLLVYQVFLATLVYFAWPQDQRLDLSARPDAAKALVDLVFLGQYVLAALMVPSFSAGTITGEKERKTYEMLLASPLRPSAIVLGKIVASLTHLAVLIFASLPIIMLCLPLGGVSPYEVMAAYFGLMVSVIVFGAISVACSSYFQRTAASLVVSYLLILPLALMAITMWFATAPWGQTRLLLTVTAFPAAAAVVFGALFVNTSRRLLHPPDVGSEGKEVVDLDAEAETAVGLVIQRDQFPDRLFAPPKRQSLLEDGVNPVFDKETHSEIFSQGTLMLRIVIQVSMLLAILFMAFWLYIWPHYCASYVAYVLLFNLLVGPVFSAGTVTSERERQTLDLLLTTIVTPWQILSGKLRAGLRVSSVLTMFLVFPILLACVMVAEFWDNLLPVAVYVGIILLTCLTTSMLALFCSVVFQKTATSLIACYLVLLVLFAGPIAGTQFFQSFFADRAVTEWIEEAAIVSPVAVVYSVPLDMGLLTREENRGEVMDESGNLLNEVTWPWRMTVEYVAFTALLNLLLLVTMIWLFKMRWRVAG
jgi:ABC-type transport system involved in multi-copper enzyme maturation permease subunit